MRLRGQHGRRRKRHTHTQADTGEHSVARWVRRCHGNTLAACGLVHTETEETSRHPRRKRKGHVRTRGFLSRRRCTAEASRGARRSPGSRRCVDQDACARSRLAESLSGVVVIAAAAVAAAVAVGSPGLCGSRSSGALQRLRLGRVSHALRRGWSRGDGAKLLACLLGRGAIHIGSGDERAAAKETYTGRCIACRGRLVGS
jgi:hypothetical protein